MWFGSHNIDYALNHKLKKNGKDVKKAVEEKNTKQENEQEH